MTKKKAIERLVEKKELSTAMLKPLGISMDSFLQFCQLPDQEADRVLDKLIAHFTKSH